MCPDPRLTSRETIIMLATIALLSGVLSVASASAVKQKETIFAASSIAGETQSAVFPPSSAAAFNPLNPLFPDASQVGFAGPTPTGDEALVMATAPAISKVTNAFPLVESETEDKKPDFNMMQFWGNLGPWFSIDSLGLPESSALIPSGCELNQVHLLHRHGARYPTSGSDPAKFAATVHSVVTAGTGFTATGALEFLNTWTYKLGAEILTPFGREQMYDLGVGFRVRYGDLLKNFTQLPVFRTTSEDRMVHSALNFAAGFFGVPFYQTEYNQLIIIESDGFNNTLAPFSICNNSNSDTIGNFGAALVDDWIDQYLTPTLKRIQPLVQGLNLTTTDLYAMQQLCAYETVALGFSSFCELFTEQEWKDFEYSIDLGFWYENGPGQPTSASMGIGWVQELVSRLTKEPIAVNNSTTNGTLDDNEATFPLGQPVYVDASHDTVISAILVALNFTSFAANGPLPDNHIPNDQTYIVSQLAPFGTNLVGQVLSCPASSSEPTHIRFVLNDAVVPLTGINGCTEDRDGLCKLSGFISGMKQQIQEVDFAFDCFANFTVPMPDTIVNGRPSEETVAKAT